MSNYKIRDEFEAAFAKKTASMGPTEDIDDIEEFGGFESVLIEAMKQDRVGESYRTDVFASAWWAWQASREALVIELPQSRADKGERAKGDGGLLSALVANQLAIDECRKSVEAAGLKVRS